MVQRNGRLRSEITGRPRMHDGNFELERRLRPYAVPVAVRFDSHSKTSPCSIWSAAMRSLYGRVNARWQVPKSQVHVGRGESTGQLLVPVAVLPVYLPARRHLGAGLPSPEERRDPRHGSIGRPRLRHRRELPKLAHA